MLTLQQQYIYVILLYVIVSIANLLYIFCIAPCTNKFCVFINNMQQQCVIKTDDSLEFLTAARGGNYLTSAAEKEKVQKLKTCPVTFWSTTHFILYFLLGAGAPQLFWETFTVGVIFEIFEYSFDCHDVLDIFINTSGFLLGRFLFYGY